MKLQRNQSGVVLIVALIMLVILTIYAVTSANLASIDLKIAGNAHDRKLAQLSAEQAVQEIISSQSNFDSPAARSLTINGIPIAVAAPACLYSSSASGYFMTGAAQTSLAPKDMQWEIQATATDPISGAMATVHQGIRMRLPAGSDCP